MTAGDVALLATELAISRATAYRLIKLFRAGGTVMSLVDRKRGRPDGHRVLDDQREEIIRTTISRYYLTRNRPTVSQFPGCANELHVGRAQAAASPNDQGSSRRHRSAEARQTPWLR
ncbi:helix-turn-helix domain-containing protein [Sinorhizobium meliloti]|uniref:helix-turn-helix domain-containing protein n=1 Tax=Rhizobium meliloti TaxID=382 RepID=UPI003F5CDF7B